MTRVRLTLLMIPTALAGCSDNEPAAPPASTMRAGPVAQHASTLAACPHKRIYPITENTWELASISVNGHSSPGVASDGGTFDYSLDITSQIASDLQQSAIDGCLAQVQFVTGGEVGILGHGQASFSASTHVTIAGFATGGTDVDETFQDGYNSPPQPAGCTLIVCVVSTPRVVVIPATVQTVFQPGGKIAIHSDATAYVNSGGMSVWDQALANFSIPHGSGRNPNGPLLVITFP